jgi:hypothetical protein
MLDRNCYHCLPGSTAAIIGHFPSRTNSPGPLCILALFPSRQLLSPVWSILSPASSRLWNSPEGHAFDDIPISTAVSGGGFNRSLEKNRNWWR